MSLLNQPLELSPDFLHSLDVMEQTNDNLFVTGKAGTGKSTLLHIFKKTTKKRTVVLAPTGLAALNVKGQTIHSFFGFPPKYLTSEEIKKRRNYKMFKNIDTIIIDEVSMVRADMIDNIDRFLRVNRMINLPFGGVQMIFFGDLFQLPPIVATPFEKQVMVNNFETPYFYSAHVFEYESSFEILYLNKIYRQDERHFIRLLDNIRSMYFDMDDLETLNDRYTTEDFMDDYYVTLSPRLNTVKSINQKRISTIQESEQIYTAKVDGTFDPRFFPAEQQLILKKNAQVMFIKNDPEKRFVNGTIGKVIRADHDTIVVQIQDEQEEVTTFEVDKMDWEMYKYKYNAKSGNVDSEVIGTFTQYPLKLAWAITIHKSQGQTFDRVIIDMGQGAFAYGQSYVALSRCRTLQGIILKTPFKPSDIKVDPRIVDFYQSFR